MLNKKLNNNWMSEKFDSNFITRQLEISKMECEQKTVGQVTFKNRGNAKKEKFQRPSSPTKKKYDAEFVRNLTAD